MFRSKGQLGRIKDIYNQNSLSRSATIALSSREIKLIEDTHVLAIGEKLELVLVALGKKLTTEVGGKDLTIKERRQIEELLSQLPFPFYYDELINVTEHGRKVNIKWFQVSVNETVSYFMKNHADDLTDMELGVLYGFGTPSIRAFFGLIEQSDRAHPNTPAGYYLGHVYSKDFYNDDTAQLEEWWRMIEEISPRIVEQARKELETVVSEPKSLP